MFKHERNKMVFDLRDESASNVALFEAYVNVREQLRNREMELHAGRGIGLKGPEEEVHQERGRELQIEHLRQEYEEGMQYSRMMKAQADEAKYKIMLGALDSLLHCMTGKRWAKAFLKEDDGITVAEMLRRITAEETRARESIKKLAHIKLPKYGPQ